MRKTFFILIITVIEVLFHIDRCFAQTDSIMTFESFDYDDYGNIIFSGLNGYLFNPSRDERVEIENYTTYPSSYIYSDNTFIQNMVSKRILNRPISVMNYKSNDKGNTVVREKLGFFVYDTTYSFLPIAQYHTPYGMAENIPQPDFNSVSLTIDSRFRKSFQVDSIDTYGRPLQVTDRAGISTCYFYSPKGLLVGKVQNATLQDIAYRNCSYEVQNDLAQGWTIVNPTSEWSSIRFDLCEKTGLDPAKEYILSFWAVLTNGAVTDHDYQIDAYGGTTNLIDTFDFIGYIDGLPQAIFTYKISGTQTVTLHKKTVGVGNPYLNKIRLHPLDADFQSYEYTVNNGEYKIYQHLNSLNRSNFFAYDERGRLIWMRDEKGTPILEKSYMPWNY